VPITAPLVHLIISEPNSGYDMRVLIAMHASAKIVLFVPPSCSVGQDIKVRLELAQVSCLRLPVKHQPLYDLIQQLMTNANLMSKPPSTPAPAPSLSLSTIEARCLLSTLVPIPSVYPQPQLLGKNSQRLQLNVLLAEDQAMNARIVMIMLKKIGCDADHVMTGTGVLEALESGTRCWRPWSRGTRPTTAFFWTG